MAEFTFFMNFIGVLVMGLSIVIVTKMASDGIGIVLAAITNVSNASDELAADFSNSIKWN